MIKTILTWWSLLLIFHQFALSVVVFPSPIFLRLSGGSSSLSDKVKADEVGQTSGTCAVVVSTSIGSAFLDKKKRVLIARNSTVADLKNIMAEKFPGSPPVKLQKLYFGAERLNDSQVVSNVSSVSPIPILLDMITGTSSYNKTLSVSQAMEAYASLITQQAFLGDKLRSFYSAEVGVSVDESSDLMDSVIYREMFLSINESLYEAYADDVLDALTAEMEPEIDSADTAPWRDGKKQRGPLAVAFAKEFDINPRSMRSFIYYSILLGVCT